MARYRNITGIERVQKTLANYPVQAREHLISALNQGAEEVHRDAIALAPGRGSRYGTGELKGAIEVKQSLAGFSATGAVGNFATQGDRGPEAGLERYIGVFPDRRGAPGWYAAFVEFGTSPRVQGQRYTQRSGRARTAKGTHPGTRPQPFMFPAWRANKQKILARLKRAITKAGKLALGNG